MLNYNDAKIVANYLKKYRRNEDLMRDLLTTTNTSSVKTALNSMYGTFSSITEETAIKLMEFKNYFKPVRNALYQTKCKDKKKLLTWVLDDLYLDENMILVIFERKPSYFMHQKDYEIIDFFDNMYHFLSRN